MISRPVERGILVDRLHKGAKEKRLTEYGVDILVQEKINGEKTSKGHSHLPAENTFIKTTPKGHFDHFNSNEFLFLSSLFCFVSFCTTVSLHADVIYLNHVSFYITKILSQIYIYADVFIFIDIYICAYILLSHNVTH